MLSPRSSLHFGPHKPPSMTVQTSQKDQATGEVIITLFRVFPTCRGKEHTSGHGEKGAAGSVLGYKIGKASSWYRSAALPIFSVISQMATTSRNHYLPAPQFGA
ncbi:hypothetical protein CHARACLAT_017806 [Characodon lateralis]|uniref:Uncharacterized protein n=1 Tax=Characodon lateralis TaxID=208331 RepID=A0ABU7EMP8_9TELE|nr:hypothetical protein [Characodon lateralis]